ncbi:MAG: heavy metal translocating P-type ATPase [Eubacteriales bacterium]|nr:heavy metal translocating P-type ATPase [Eubacteriales bacterium]
MKKYNITGMSCAACSSRIEKVVSALDNVESCSVSLLTNSMGVEGDVDADTVIEAVKKAGYGASLKENARGDRKKSSAKEYEEALEDRETPILKRRLILSVIILLPLMYVSMGGMMWGWPLPSFLADNHMSMGLYQLVLTTAVMVINQKFFISGFTALINKAPNMDTLVALGSSASYIYSLVQLFIMSEGLSQGNSELVMSAMHELYFESAAMILTLITMGKMLESRAKGKTTDALKSLMKLAPSTARIERNGIEEEVYIEEVEPGDIFIVKQGETIPVDGEVLDGEAAVNEASLTGESIPVDKLAGDKVSAATINTSGYLRCRAVRVGEDTTLSQIIQMVSDAAATKAPIAKVADRISGIFVPSVISIALITMFVWLILGKDFGFALARGISVLVISCPCALGLATPVAIMVGNGMGAKHGIMFKTAVSLEETGKADIVVLDKTGTITKGEPKVTDIIPVTDLDENDFIRLAVGAEYRSEHPLAFAIMENCKEKSIEVPEAKEWKGYAGNGIEAIVDGYRVAAGKLDFIKTKCTISDEVKAISQRLADEGKTPLYFSKDGELIGVIAVADVIKEESTEAISELKGMGMKVVMLTGDNRNTAEAIGKVAGVDKVIANVLPDGKEEVVRELMTRGKVIMVGDGINDAPALTRADIGIAIGAGTDVAIDAADIVLMKSRLSDVPAAIRLSRQVLKNIHENLFWAFFYNALGIPLAMGVFIGITGWELNPMFGAAAMSLSSFCVVTNALRLNLFNIYDKKRDKKQNKKINIALDDIKEENKMTTKTMEIKGMMCGHCEAHVKKALEAINGVSTAEVSHTEGTAVVSMDTDIDNEILKNAVTEEGYEVVSIK